MGIKRFRDWNILAKISALVIFTVIPFVLLVTLILLPRVEERFIADKKDNVRQTVEVVYYIIESYNSLASKGIITEQEAQNKAIKEIETLRYNEDDYFWLKDTDMKMIMHPINPKLNGQDLEDMEDPTGKKFFTEMVNVAKNNGAGFVEYMWPKPGYEKPVPKITYVKLYKKWGWIVGSGVYVEDIDEELSAFNNSFFTFFVIALIISLALGWFIGRLINRPIKELSSVSDKVSEGDYDIRANVKSHDELGKLAESFNKMIHKIKTAISEVEEKSEAAERAQREAEEAHAAVTRNQEYLARSTRHILAEMEKFAEGDLTVKVKAENDSDDIGRLFAGFNKAVDNLRALMGKVKLAIETTTSSSTQISATTEEMAAGAHEQNAQTNEVAGAMEEMTKTILETTANAGVAAESSKKATEYAELGEEKARKSKEGMLNIVESSRLTVKVIQSLVAKTNTIEDITRVINEIADQTNLLALNAAIEAARAGEQGRGFAVVADEVRKLAERTAHATKDISSNINSIQTEVKEADSSVRDAEKNVGYGMELLEEVEDALVNILESVKHTSRQIDQVAAASEQQSSAAEQVSRNIEGINSITSEASEGIQQVATSADDLSRLTLNLSELIETFRFEKNEKREEEYSRGAA